MSLGSALAIATSGLNSINNAIAVLSQNVANVGTPNYSREIAVQVVSTAGGVGDGVAVRPTVRDVNAQLQGQSLLQNAEVSGLQLRQKALQQIDAVQGQPGDGTDLGSLLGALGDAFSALQNDPANQAQQQAVVVAAQTLTHQINTLSATYQSQRQAAQDGLGSDLASLNSTLAEIGALSDQIIAQKANGQSTADLENQRDTAASDLSSLLSTKFVAQSNGDVQVYTTGGLSLPTRFSTPPFAVAGTTLGAGASYPGNGAPAVTLGTADVTGQLTGGKIGAGITLRDKTLPTDQAELDEFSQSLTSRFAAQGLTLFSQPDGTVPAAGGSPAQTGYVGYAGAITVNPAVVDTPSLVRDGTQNIAGSASGASVFTTNPPGGPAGFTGLISRILDYALGSDAQAGVAQPAPAVDGLGVDGSLAAPFGPPGSLSQFASDLVSAQEQDSAKTTTQLTSAQSLQTALQANLSSTTGVNIDSELAHLVSLQNAYGANAKILGTLQTLFNDVASIVGA